VEPTRTILSDFAAAGGLIVCAVGLALIVSAVIQPLLPKMEHPRRRRYGPHVPLTTPDSPGRPLANPSNRGRTRAHGPPAEARGQCPRPAALSRSDAVAGRTGQLIDCFG